MVLPQTQGATGPPIASAPSGRGRGSSESKPRPQAWAKVTSHETPDLALHLPGPWGAAQALARGPGCRLWGRKGE